MTGPCSGESGRLNARSFRKSTASSTCPDGREMRSSAGSQRRRRSPPAVIFNFVAPPDSVPKVPEPLGDLVTVGNLDFVKNHRYLLDVLAEAKKAGQVFTLDVFGEGPLRSDLVGQINSLGLEDQVRLRGFRQRCSDSSSGLSGLCPRFVLRVVIVCHHRGDGGRPSDRGGQYRAHFGALR